MKMLRGGVGADEFSMCMCSLRRIIETTRVVAPVRIKPMITYGRNERCSEEYLKGEESILHTPCPPTS
jgi:hypothetical protein